jgi:adenosine deaminase
MVPSPSQGAAGEEMGDLTESLRRLPKAELHQHLDGALRPETAVELAAAVGLNLSLDEARQRMVAPPHCANQAELLSYFDLPISLLQTDSALRRAAAELVVTLAEERVVYAEIRWAPRLHLERGLGVGAVIEAVAQGVEDAMDRLGSSAPAVSLIVTAMRSHPPAANVLLAREAAAFGEPVVAFDLAGLEAEWPAPPHAAAFLAAAEGGLKLTAHAGEVPGSDHIREALDLGASRIAHGVTAVDDSELVEELKRLDVTLDMCPTSNVQAGIVAGLAQHPLARLHRLGVSVTCSTDDRVVSDTDLTDELARTATTLRLTRQELSSIALNAFRRAFGPSMVVDRLLGTAMDEWSAWEKEATALLS